MTALRSRFLASLVALSAAALSVASAAPGPPILDGHGWFALPDDSSRITRILHLPPRDSERTLGALGFAPGVSSPVERIAWWADSVFMVLIPEHTSDADTGRAIRIRPVFTLRAARTPVGTWAFPPDRPEILPALPSAGEIAGFSAGGLGAAALLTPIRVSLAEVDSALRSEEVANLDLRLLPYTGRSWLRVQLPWQSGPSADRPPVRLRTHVRLWCDRDSVNLLLFHRGDTTAERWIGRPQPAAPDLVGPPRFLEWRSETFPLTPAGASDSIRPDKIFLVPGREPPQDVLLAGARVNDGQTFWRVTDDNLLPLARIDSVPRQSWVIPMAAGANAPSAWGRIALVWRERPEAAPDSTAPRSRPAGGVLHITEISAQTGRTLYSGAARNDGLLSPQRFQTVAVALVLMTACLLAFVLRSDSGALTSLPEGVAPADPIRRAIAAAIDYLCGAAAAALVLDAPLTSTLNFGALILHDAELSPVLLAAAFAAVQCTLGEWLFGRSIGKWATGCAVAAIRPPESGPDGPAILSRPGLWQAAVRNLIRWALPLLAMFVLIDALARHPGDLAGRTIVITRSPERKPEDSE